MDCQHIYTPGQHYWDVKAIRQKRHANFSKFNDKGIHLFMNDSVIESIVSQSTSLFLIPIIDNKSKIGFINDKCEIIVDPCFDLINGTFYDSNNLVAVCKEKLWNVINSSGKELLDGWSKYMIVPSRDSKMITINSKAIMNVEDVGSLQYIKGVKYVGGFRYGFARIHQDGGWGIINENGAEVLPAIYEEVYSFYDYPKPTTKVRKDKEGKLELIQLNDLR